MFDRQFLPFILLLNNLLEFSEEIPLVYLLQNYLRLIYFLFGDIEYKISEIARCIACALIAFLMNRYDFSYKIDQY